MGDGVGERAEAGERAHAGERVRAGVRTFLFTDIEASTASWQAAPDGMPKALADHDRILGDAVEAAGGSVIKHTGDGVLAVFDGPRHALRAAVEAQDELLRTAPFTVRMAIATGEASERDGDWFGPAVNRAARLLDAGHGGQVLVSSAAAALIHDLPLPGVDLIALGEYRLRGLTDPEVVHQVAADGLPQRHPPLHTAASPVHTLPAARTSLIGRKQEIAELQPLLDTRRVLTITGVGGVGKTRLALELATRSMEQFPGGSFFVELSSVTDAAGVASAAAAALAGDGAAFVGTSSALDQVVAYLAGREALVVLDNCEHVLDAAADLIDELVDRCPGVRVLTTSREPIGVEGEQVWRAPSLAAGDAGGEAVELFVDRAATAGSVDLSGPEREVVAEICERLDGIPLAIELAAAQTAHLSPSELLARLHDRFALLAGGRRRVQRQQTLHAAVQWSHDLLEHDEQVLLRRLSVFAGWFDARAAESVCRLDGSVVRMLGSLVGKSLVVANERRTKYRLLETIRLFAEDQLVAAGEADDVRNRHAAWVTDLVVAADETSDWTFEAMEVLGEIADDLRLAGNWLVDTAQAAPASQVVARAGTYWWLSGRAGEQLDLLRRIDMDQLAVDDRTRAETARLGAAILVGDMELALQLGSELDDQHWRQPSARFLQAQLHYGLILRLRARDEAEEQILRVREAAESIGATHIATMARDYLAVITFATDPPAALAEWEQLWAAGDRERRRIDDYFVTISLGIASHIVGDHQRTADMADDLQRRGFTMGRWAVSSTVPMLRTLVAAARGDLDGARQLLRAMVDDRGNTILHRENDVGLAASAVALAAGDHERAALLLGAVRGPDELFTLPTPIAYPLHRQHRSQLAASLEPERQRTLYDEGRSLDVLPLAAAVAAEA